MNNSKETFAERMNERSQLVVKSNTLIQESRLKSKLSLQEQKIILFLISKIKKDDVAFQEYEFELNHLCDIFGIERNGKNYFNFKNSIQSLADKSFWVKNGDVETLCRWIEKVIIDKGTTKVHIRLDDTLLPYLIALKNRYTMYELCFILNMKSKYGIRLYEILRSYAYKGKYISNIDDLKVLLGINKKQYKIYNNFKVDVIDKAINDINTYTDLIISYTPIRTVRTITAIEFNIKKRNVYESASILYSDNKILESKIEKEQKHD